MIDIDNLRQWYAMRVFFNNIFKVRDEMEAAGARTYMAMKTVRETVQGRTVVRKVQLAPSLLFVECSKKELTDYCALHPGRMMLYRSVLGREPEPIEREEMEMFIKVTSAAQETQDIDFLGREFEFRPGDKVRVTGGLYKGAEGYIKRIKKDRKLIVAVSGVAVVALSHIPQEFLERV